VLSTRVPASPSLSVTPPSSPTPESIQASGTGAVVALTSWLACGASTRR